MIVFVLFVALIGWQLFRQQIIKQGYQSYQSQDYTRAIQKFTQAIRFFPLDARPFFYRGLAYESCGNLTEALVNYERTLKRQPNYAPAYERRAQIYLAQGQKEAAIADFNTIVRLNPHSETSYLARATTYFKLEYYDEVLRDSDKVIELSQEMLAKHERFKVYMQGQDKEPQFNLASAYNLRGLAYQRLERFDEAIQAYEKSLEFEPTLAVVHNNLGELYFQQQAYTEALAAFDKAFELENGLQIARAGRAVTLYVMGETDICT